MLAEIGVPLRFTREEERQIMELSYALHGHIRRKKPPRTEGDPVPGWQAQVVFCHNQLGRIIRRALERSHAEKSIKPQ